MAHLVGNIYIVTAPSGAGKTTLVSALLSAEPTVRLSVSYTTRSPREGERDGVNYHFVDRATFLSKLEKGEFLEHAEVYGQFYGTSAPWIRQQLSQGHDILLEIDWQGARQVRKMFPDAISIFILPPSLAVLESRLRGRATDSEEVITRRLAAVRTEIERIDEFEYVVINDDIETAKRDLISIVHAERLRRLRQQPLVRELLHDMKAES